MVVMLALHLEIFLEICTAVAYLHSLLMSAIVVSDKFANAILVFVLRSDSLRLLTCVVVQRLPVRLLGRLYLCACWGIFYLRLVLSICVLQSSVRMRHVTFADSYLAANIESWNKACTLSECYL